MDKQTGPWIRGPWFDHQFGAKKLYLYATPSSVSVPDVKQRKSTFGVTFSTGHAGASKKSPKDRYEPV